MPFNTRKPIPSGDLRDLDDNARNIDTWANDKTKLSHPDRFGVERRTWHGIEQEAQLNIQQAIDAKNAAQEAAMMSGFSKYADTLAQLESGIGTDYIEGDVVLVFQDESRGDASSIYKVESGVAVFKNAFDKTRQDLLSFTGNISADAEWSDVPAHSDPAFDVQAQALANRVEYLNELAHTDSPGGNKRTIQEKLALELRSAADWPGIDRSGVTPLSAAFKAFLDYACANGGVWEIPDGVYLMDTGVRSLVSASVQFNVSPNAKFIAAPGFPRTKMFLFDAGSGSGHSFTWNGGRFNGENIPRSGPGEALDVFNFNGENCSSATLIFDEVYSGDNFTTSGSDTLVGSSSVDNLFVWVKYGRGANDAGVYITGNREGTVGKSLKVFGNFYGCEVGVIVKRNYSIMELDANVVECNNGIGTGGVTDGGYPWGGDGVQLRARALRTNRAAFLQGTRGGSVDVVSVEAGCTYSGTVTGTQALALQGASCVTGSVSAYGVNPAYTKNNNFTAVSLTPMTDAVGGGGTRNPVGNNINVTARDIGRSVIEASGADENLFTILESGTAAEPSIIGASTKVIRSKASGFSCFSGSDISIGGKGATESGAIAWFRSSALKTNANRLQVSAGDTGEQVAIRATGADADIKLLIEAKGQGSVAFNTGQVKNFADDAAAAAGGIPLGGIYRTSNTLKIRMV